MPENPLTAGPTVRQFHAPFFQCAVRDNDDDTSWIDATGELDLAAAPLLDEALRKAATRSHRVLDLRAITFMDCAGLSVIVGAHNHANRTATRLMLVRGPSQVDRIFSLTGTSSTLEIVDLHPSEPLSSCSLGSPESDGKSKQERSG